MVHNVCIELDYFIQWEREWLTVFYNYFGLVSGLFRDIIFYTPHLYSIFWTFSNIITFWT